MADWEQQASEYRLLTSRPLTAEAHERIRTLIGEAASSLPKDRPDALWWFISALRDKDKKWFVAKVLTLSSPMPRTLLEPMLIAGLMERNPSNNRQFIEPCVRTFGNTAIAIRLRELATTLEETEHDALSQALYWVPGSRT